jgi:redox-sensitive bicupin YhaK (pirin superfamily)
METTIFRGRETRDGAGVRLTRIFGNDRAQLTDPFLLLDHFGSDDPADYVKGFPWHPHRGIETVTYMLEGLAEHGDSLGNAGTIGPGDLQWMTAGSGIVHQEMPKPLAGRMYGFQLWVNLPRRAKMMPPRYRDIAHGDVPVVREDGVEVRVIAGAHGGARGPVRDLVVDVAYLDVALAPGAAFSFPVAAGRTAFCYLFEGRAAVAGSALDAHDLLLARGADRIDLAANGAARCILVSGAPLGEPIAWGGPIVMNTREELELAFRELDAGTFIKK